MHTCRPITTSGSVDYTLALTHFPLKNLLLPTTLVYLMFMC